MGRKIPGKKHRTVKDPYEQRARRFSEIKNKINNAPVRPDEQPVPKSLSNLMKWKERLSHTRSPNSKKSRDRIDINNKTVAKKKMFANKNPSTNPLQKLRKLDGESNRSFNARINDALKTLKGGTTMKDIAEDLPDKNPTDAKKRVPFKKKKKINEERLTKSQKKTLKEKDKKDRLKQEKNANERFAIKIDKVKFGEVVHEPPSFRTLPRRAERSDGAPRPALKNLLLCKLFDASADSNLAGDDAQAINLKGKRRELPGDIRKQLESSQREAIEAYRLVKLSKIKNKDDRI